MPSLSSPFKQIAQCRDPVCLGHPGVPRPRIVYGSMSEWASAACVMKVSKIYCSLLFPRNILGPQGLHANCIPQSWITWSRSWAWEAQESNVYRVEVALQGVRSGVRTRALLCFSSSSQDAGYFLSSQPALAENQRACWPQISSHQDPLIFMSRAAHSQVPIIPL